MAIILSKDMIYSTMKGIVLSRCRLTTRHLGATLFKLRLYQICKSHVAASMHHDTWGLPIAPVNNSRYISFKSIIIEGSIAQLVKHKALNFVDVGSSPMMEITLYDVIINELYTKSLLIIA